MPFRERRFRGDQTDFELLSECAICKHKHLGADSCRAFLGGIPPALLNGTAKHRQPYEGDNGIQFEPIEGPTT